MEEMRLHQQSETIWTIDFFLSEKECKDLIILSENKGYDEAKVSFQSGAKMMKGLRNNLRLMYEDGNLANDYWLKLKSFCPEKIEKNLATGLNKRFRFYKYTSKDLKDTLMEGLKSMKTKKAE
ncbi:MAG: hypothetical protein AAGI07_00155 [Bacteroidota bacterium]